MEIRSRHTWKRKRPLAARMEGATSLSRTPGWTCSSRGRTINRTCTVAASALTTAAMHTMWPVTRGSTQGRGPSTAVSATRLFHTGLTYERTKRCTQVKNRSGVSFASEHLCRTFTLCITKGSTPERGRFSAGLAGKHLSICLP
ncbi:unnamed protein product [Ixodes persulcatus]